MLSRIHRGPSSSILQVLPLGVLVYPGGVGERLEHHFSEHVQNGLPQEQFLVLKAWICVMYNGSTSEICQ